MATRPSPLSSAASLSRPAAAVSRRGGSKPASFGGGAVRSPLQRDIAWDDQDRNAAPADRLTNSDLVERGVARMCREEIVSRLLEGCIIVGLGGMGYSPTNRPPSSPLRTN
jgi:hypothetical protein